MSSEKWEDPVLDALIEALKILDKEKNKNLQKLNASIHKLREYGIKLPLLEEEELNEF